jgi:hypothetical protein
MYPEYPDSTNEKDTSFLQKKTNPDDRTPKIYLQKNPTLEELTKR